MRSLFSTVLLTIVSISMAWSTPQLSFAPSYQRGMSSNSMSTIIWDGTDLWAASGSGLSRSLGVPETALDWIFFTEDDGLPTDIIPALTASNGRVFISSASYLDQETSYTLDFGNGITVSDDRGETWETRSLDRAEGLGNICWQLASIGDTLWAACWNGLADHVYPSGIAVSTDAGETWSFPDISAILGPSTFSVAARGTECWVGTGAGIGITKDLGETWTASNYAENDLSGDWVVALGLPPGDTLTAWAATRRIPDIGSGSAYGIDGISVTMDGGENWITPGDLEGITAWDFAFRGDSIWIAAEEGLAFSPDGGSSWNILDIDDGLPRETFYSIEIVGDRIYAGSSDGLVWSKDSGQTWEVMLASQPQGTADTPRTYCYPNPFSPSRNQEARIRYNLAESGRIYLHIFDFAENTIRKVVDGEIRELGELLFEVWDGRDDGGRIVPNGTYFYKLWTDAGADASYGKIMVLD